MRLARAAEVAKSVAERPKIAARAVAGCDRDNLSARPGWRRFARRSTDLTIILDGTVLHTFSSVPSSAMYAVAGAAGLHGFIATTKYSLL